VSSWPLSRCPTVSTFGRLAADTPVGEHLGLHHVVDQRRRDDSNHAARARNARPCAVGAAILRTLCALQLDAAFGRDSRSGILRASVTIGTWFSCGPTRSLAFMHTYNHLAGKSSHVFCAFFPDFRLRPNSWVFNPVFPVAKVGRSGAVINPHTPGRTAPIVG